MRTNYLVQLYKSINSEACPIPIDVVYYDTSKKKTIQWLNNYFKRIANDPKYKDKFIGLVLSKAVPWCSPQVMRVSFKDSNNKVHKEIIKK